MESKEGFPIQICGKSVANSIFSIAGVTSKKDIFSAYWIWIVPKKKPKSRSSTPYNLKKQMAF